MAPKIYWTKLDEAPGGVAIITRPRATPYLDEDMASLRRGGVDIVASLLEAREAADVGLAGEGEAAHAAVLEFVSFPVPDHAVPSSLGAYDALARRLADDVREGRNIACHCFAGLGRSPTLAAGVLIQLGLSADEAIKRLSAARRVQVPEMDEQFTWIRDYAIYVNRRDGS